MSCPCEAAEAGASPLALPKRMLLGVSERVCKLCMPQLETEKSREKSKDMVSSIAQETRQNLKQKYGRFYEGLILLLTMYDLIHLPTKGISRDECEPVVDTILLQLDKATSSEKLGQILYRALIDCFGSAFAAPEAPSSEQTKEHFDELGAAAWYIWGRWEEELQPRPKKSTYKAVQPYTKEEAEAAFAQGTRAEIIDALLGVTYYVEDWRWVQTACLAWLDRPESGVQWNAIQCLGHLATFHHTLDLAIVLPALQAHLSNPALASVFYDALGDIAGVEDTSYFEENWNELPPRIKDVLIEGGIFESNGRHIGKWNLIRRLRYRIREYKAARPHTKAESEKIFAQGTSDQIESELRAIVFHGKHWRWVQATCLASLNASDTTIQFAALEGLEKLLWFHRKLDLAIVLPALQAYASGPTRNRKVNDAFIGIAISLKKAPGLVKNWDELPQTIKKIVRENASGNGIL